MITCYINGEYPAEDIKEDETMDKACKIDFEALLQQKEDEIHKLSSMYEADKLNIAYLKGRIDRLEVAIRVAEAFTGKDISHAVD